MIKYILLDIDECAEDIDGCAQNCSNVDGSYSCSCYSGYRIAIDEHGCEGSYSFPTHLC